MGEANCVDGELATRGHNESKRMKHMAPLAVQRGDKHQTVIEYSGNKVSYKQSVKKRSGPTEHVDVKLKTLHFHGDYSENTEHCDR